MNSGDIILATGVLRFRLRNEVLIACGGCRLASLIIR